MRLWVCSLSVLMAFALTFEASANPDGAPWGSADPQAAQTCSSCHFDHEPNYQSGRVRVVGDVPKAFRAGASYNFLVTVQSPGPATVGFILEARAQSDQQESERRDGGSFVATEAVEVKASQIRSTALNSPNEDGFVSWRVTWKAPEGATGPVQFFLAANISNDDMSPFGDQIEYLTFSIPLGVPLTED